MKVTYDDIMTAHERIKDTIYETPIVRLYHLEETLGCHAYAKLENTQLTHSFKIRGALNAIRKLSTDELSRGVIAGSSGNHGQAVSYIAKLLNIPCTIVVPNTASPFKVDKIKNNGAHLVFCPSEERTEVANRIAKEEGLTLISSADHEDIIAGQGTIGLELNKSDIDFSHVVVPMSGGGLLSGIALAVKEGNSNAQVIGVESNQIPRFTTSVKNDEITLVETKETIADALILNKPGVITFDLVKAYVDELVAVDDEASLKKARRMLLDSQKILAEHSSSIGIAACLEGKLKFSPEDHVCFVISGGNTLLDF